MSRIFVSPNQPALFPLMSSFSSISMEDYHLFYKKDRSLLTILLVVLHREVVQSILVMGFLLWLEREGYTSKNLVENIMSSLTPDLIDRVADEAVICLKLMVKKSNNFVLEGSHDISMLQCFLDRKCVHLDDFYRDRDLIFDEVTCIADELSTKAFHDILEKYTRCGEPLVLHTPQAVNGNVNGNGFHYVGLDKYNANGEDSHQRNLLIDRLYARGNSSCVIRELKEEIPQENRTIFLTFSKGYPISENEVRDYFTRMYGDFIESIFMQPVDPENQPLFARIVARSPSMVSVVVDRDGTDGKSKYYINGKHVWARKYVKRTSSKDANGSLQA